MKGVSNHPGFEAMVHPGVKSGSTKKKGSGIHINPAHKGKLTKKVGKEGLTVGNLTSEIADAKKKHNVPLERELVFAKNAKTKFHKK